MLALEVKQVGKKYLVRHERASIVNDLFLWPFKRLQPKEFWALRDVSFQVKSGETVGIIGENGAGKSTLLKILTGVTVPTNGSVIINGRVGALLELGVGFHPELTGRENIFLNAAIIGMAKREIEGKLDDIVEFAGIRDFIDVPIKTYSSGMFVRLAFAAAISVEPDILLIDEALAVGDIEFQRKCMRHLIKYQQAGKTVLLVSHDLAVVKAVCQTAICFRGGAIVDSGNAGEVVDRYVLDKTESPLIGLSRNGIQPYQRTLNDPGGLPHQATDLIPSFNRLGNGMVQIKEIHYVDDSGHPISIAEFGQMVNLSILFEVRTACPRVTIAFYVKDRSRLDVIGTNSDNENTSLFEVKAGELYSSRFRFALRLKQGAYSVTIILAAGPQTADYYDWIEDAVSFEVFHPTRRLYALYSPPMDVSITRFSPVV